MYFLYKIKKTRCIQENKIGKSTYWLWLGKAEEILNNAMLLDEKWTEIGL